MREVIGSRGKQITRLLSVRTDEGFFLCPVCQTSKKFSNRIVGQKPFLVSNGVVEGVQNGRFLTLGRGLSKINPGKTAFDFPIEKWGEKYFRSKRLFCQQ